jgi:hypothetical protein
MATAFDGIGMGMLGSERKYMSQENPLSTAFKGLKDFGIMYGMEKAGVFDYLNKMGQEKQAMMDKYPGLSARKPDGSAAPPAASALAPAPAVSAPPVAANTSAPVNATEDAPISDDAADNLFKNTSGAQPGAVINQVLPASTFTPGSAAPPPVVGGAQISGVSPNVMQPRNVGQDQLAMDVASAPPSPLNLPNYQKKGNGQGEVVQLAMKFLPMLFGLG